MISDLLTGSLYNPTVSHQNEGTRSHSWDGGGLIPEINDAVQEQFGEPQLQEVTTTFAHLPTLSYGHRSCYSSKKATVHVLPVHY